MKDVWARCEVWVSDPEQEAEIDETAEAIEDEMAALHLEDALALEDLLKDPAEGETS